jgi:hypothetical protein
MMAIRDLVTVGGKRVEVEAWPGDRVHLTIHGPPFPTIVVFSRDEWERLRAFSLPPKARDDAETGESMALDLERAVGRITALADQIKDTSDSSTVLALTRELRQAARELGKLA